MMKSPTSTVQTLGDRAADAAGDALDTTQRKASEALDSLHDGVETLRREVPGKLSRAATQVESMTRRGIDRARRGSTEMRHQFDRASVATVDYIKAEPVKSVLIAAAAGAAVVGLATLLASRRRD